jgi:hypothetical protein
MGKQRENEENGCRMTQNQRMWARARDELAAAVSAMGWPEELADLIAKELGSPKAIGRITSYIRQAKPRTLETLMEEMLAIQDEIAAWKEKKESQRAQAGYNEWLRERDPE